MSLKGVLKPGVSLTMLAICHYLIPTIITKLEEDKITSYSIDQDMKSVE